MSSSLKISIVGAGQIGSRHLQALANIKGPALIQLVDPSQSALRIACQRFNSVWKEDSNRIILQTFNAIKDLDENQDVVIVSTDSVARRDVICELIQVKNVKAMIFEKVLFQTEKEYFEIGSLLKAQKIPAWVNCILRATDFFRDLKASLDRSESIRMRVEGFGWGLACNGIHFLDLFSFLTGCADFEFTDVKFDRVIADYKRPDSKEFIGEMIGENSKGHQLVLNCKDGNSSIGSQRGLKTVLIDNVTRHHEITVHEDRVINKTIIENETTQVTKPLPLQSQITHRLVEDIVHSGFCGLPNYSESSSLHLCLIREFMGHLTKISGKSVTRCPVT